MTFSEILDERRTMIGRVAEALPGRVGRVPLETPLRCKDPVQSGQVAIVERIDEVRDYCSRLSGATASPWTFRRHVHDSRGLVRLPPFCRRTRLLRLVGRCEAASSGKRD